MSFQIVSKCCLSRYTEEPSPSDTVESMNVCATCGMPCKLTRIGEPDGVPRTREQAYQDSFNQDGSLKYDPQNGILAGAKPKEALAEDTPSAEVKDGKIYQNGKLIGYAVSDRDWYKSEFGEDWKGSDEVLKKLRGQV